MLVILKEEVNGQPAYSTGHWCRLCRMRRDIEALRRGLRRLEHRCEAGVVPRIEQGRTPWPSRAAAD
jgi:hypothetical protein